LSTLLCCTMGASLSSVWRRAFGKVDLRILMLGLDSAGKTTILYKLRLGEVHTTIPTIGMNVETVEYSGKSLISFTTWDIGGRSPMRPLWRHFYKDCNAVIFVVDSNDRDRIEDAEYELSYILGAEELRDATLLVFANKQDLPRAMTVVEMTEKLKLHQLRNRQWYILGSCATSGDGLYEGLDWLSNTLQTKHTKAMPQQSKEQLEKMPTPSRISADVEKTHQGKLDQDGLESAADTESTADTEILEIA